MATTNKKQGTKLTDEVLSKRMLFSATVNGLIVKSLHQKTDFGKNDLGEDIGLDIKALTLEMETVSDQVKNGDLSNLEEMLVGQAYSLQTLFMIMTSRLSSTTNADHIELLSKIALKAQNQCRSTIATLSEMKNPRRATFVKQLNQANQMQVNNGTEVDSENLKKNNIPTTEQMENQHDKWLDTGTTQEAIGNDQDLETMEPVNRGKDN